MYNAAELANYIVEYERAHKRSITHLRLQFILYFLQLLFYAEFDRACFRDTVTVSGDHPIVRSVRREFAVFGSGNILLPHDYNVPEFAPQERKLITDMLDKCALRTYTQLRDAVVVQGLCRRARERFHKEITQLDFREYAAVLAARAQRTKGE